METIQTLTPLEFLKPNSEVKLALVVLNQPLLPQLHLFKAAWDNAVIKVGVDGGANEIYKNTEGERDKYCPDLVTGDFDSVEKHFKEFYKSKGAGIIHTSDQDNTDFTKCLKVLSKREDSEKYDAIVAIGAFGGRLDQVFGNTQTLFIAKTLFPKKPVYLVSETSIACLLSKGKHCLSVSTGYESDWCGLIPLGGACNCVTTTGLKWNLDHQCLKFGELVSTSNTWDGSGVPVTIETDEPLLWTMGIK